MVLDQYTIYNNTNITLYLNSKEIEMKPGEKRWFYFDVFDASPLDVAVFVVFHPTTV